MAYSVVNFIRRFPATAPWDEIGTGDAPAANPPESVTGTGARPEGSIIRGNGTGAIGTKMYTLRGGVWTVNVDANATAQDAASALDPDDMSLAAPAAADSVSVHAAFNDNDAQPIITFTNPAETYGRNLRFSFGAAWAASPGGDLTVTGAKDQFGNVIAPFTVAANPAGDTDTAKVVKDLSGMQVTFAPGAGGAGHTCSAGVGLKFGLKSVCDAPGTLGCDGLTEPGLWSNATNEAGVTPTTPPNAAHNYKAEWHKTGATSVVTITPA